MGMQAEVISHHALLQSIIKWKSNFPYFRADDVIESCRLAWAGLQVEKLEEAGHDKLAIQFNRVGEMHLLWTA